MFSLPYTSLLDPCAQICLITCRRGGVHGQELRQDKHLPLIGPDEGIQWPRGVAFLNLCKPRDGLGQRVHQPGQYLIQTCSKSGFKLW